MSIPSLSHEKMLSSFGDVNLPGARYIYIDGIIIKKKEGK